MKCAICDTRRPRRFCPGVRGDICTICCGTEREVTVSCPLDCEYLQAARLHEKPVPFDEAQIPHRDISISEEFLEKQEALVTATAQALVTAGLETPGAIDFDVRDALAGLVRTYRTLESGVYYESVPANPLAANIYRLVQQAVGEFRQREQQQLGISRTRDADLLGAFVFLSRIEFDRNNGRRRGRAFLDFLRQFYSAGAGAPAPASSLILP